MNQPVQHAIAQTANADVNLVGAQDFHAGIDHGGPRDDQIDALMRETGNFFQLGQGQLLQLSQARVNLGAAQAKMIDPMSIKFLQLQFHAGQAGHGAASSHQQAFFSQMIMGERWLELIVQGGQQSIDPRGADRVLVNKPFPQSNATEGEASAPDDLD